MTIPFVLIGHRDDFGFWCNNTTFPKSPGSALGNHIPLITAIWVNPLANYDICCNLIRGGEGIGGKGCQNKIYLIFPPPLPSLPPCPTKALEYSYGPLHWQFSTAPPLYSSLAVSVPPEKNYQSLNNKYFTEFTEVRRCYVQPFVLP